MVNNFVASLLLILNSLYSQKCAVRVIAGKLVRIESIVNCRPLSRQLRILYSRSTVITSGPVSALTRKTVISWQQEPKFNHTTRKPGPAGYPTGWA